MAHVTARGACHDLVDRITAFPQGAPPPDLLYRTLAARTCLDPWVGRFRGARPGEGR